MPWHVSPLFQSQADLTQPMQSDRLSLLSFLPFFSLIESQLLLSPISKLSRHPTHVFEWSLLVQDCISNIATTQHGCWLLLSLPVCRISSCFSFWAFHFAILYFSKWFFFFFLLLSFSGCASAPPQRGKLITRMVIRVSPVLGYHTHSPLHFMSPASGTPAGVGRRIERVSS